LQEAGTPQILIAKFSGGDTSLGEQCQSNPKCITYLLGV